MGTYYFEIVDPVTDEVTYCSAPSGLRARYSYPSPTRSIGLVSQIAVSSRVWLESEHGVKCIKNRANPYHRRDMTEGEMKEFLWVKLKC